jgi:hypothetical protein
LGLASSSTPPQLTSTPTARATRTLATPHLRLCSCPTPIRAPLWGFGTGSTITLLSADATLRPRLTGMGGGFELYMPLEDEMMFQFSPQDLGASHDVDRSCDYRFTPVRGRRSLCPCGRQPLVWKPGLHFPLCLGPGRRDRLVSSLPTCHRPRPAFQQRMNIDDTMLPMQTAHISFREGPGAGFTPRMPATGSLGSSISALRTSLLGGETLCGAVRHPKPMTSTLRLHP